MGTVATSVVDVPSVTVRDASGKPLAGVVVTFSVTSGGGDIETSRVVSSSAGVASAGRWTLGSLRGTNVLVATIASGDSVVFTADAVAGPPFFLEKVNGDGQIASPGAVLGIRPRVSVRDLYNNRLSGVPVTFAVEAGGGSVSNAVAVTDSAGIAESGDWVLGQTGLQRMVARAGALVSEPFIARAVVPFSCAPSGELPIQVTVQSQLTALSCTGADGRLLDTYNIVVPQSGAYVFTLASTEFDTHLELRGADLIEVARTGDPKATTKSLIKVLLPPGTYTLSVSSSRPSSYGVSYQPTSPSADWCEDVFIVLGAEARGIVEGSICGLDPYEFSDRYLIHLEAGTHVEIRVEDFSYSGPNIEMVSPDSTRVRAGPSGNYLTTLAYVAPVSGYYTVLVGLLNEIGVEYRITVR
jgi:hypothetical protein